MRRNRRASSARSNGRFVLRVRDVPRRRDRDVHRGERGQPVARVLVRVHDRPRPARPRERRSTSPGVSRLPGGCSTFVQRPSPTTTTGRRKSAAASPPPPRRGGPRRTKPTTSATTAPTTANQVIHGGPASSSTYVKSPGNAIWSAIPAARAASGSSGPTMRESTPRPPAKANANGRNPAARRACEIETRSARVVKRNGHEHDREDRERAADDEGRPAPARRERGEREQQERGHRDRPARG